MNANSTSDAASGRIEDPFVTVVIPTRNRQELLERCLRSLRSQTFPRDRFEIVVVDDASSDGTPQLLASVMDVRAVRQDWQGMVAARMAGLGHARGDIVAFLDDDAEADAAWLNELVDALDQTGVAMVGGRVRAAPLREIRARIDAMGQVDWSGFDVVLDAPTRVDFVPGGNMAVWRWALDEAGGFDLEYTGSAWREETDLCVRVGRLGYGILYVPGASIDHVSARWKGGIGSRFGFQYSVARNDGYFVSKLFPGPANALRTIAVGPLKAALPDLFRAGFALALIPVRVIAGFMGYVKGTRTRTGG